MAPISRLPNEILSMFLRLATLDDESLQPTYADPFVLATYRFDEYDRSYEAFKTKLSISRVCKHWNGISAPFLCEYIYCLRGIEILEGLRSCLKRQDTGIAGKRGQWTRRVDISLNSWDPAEELDKWLAILSLTPNATIVDVSGELYNFTRWWGQLIFALGELKSLRRVQWHAKQCDLSDLQQLSLLCPQLIHITFTVEAMRDPDASTDAFTISFPNAQVVILEWSQLEYDTTVYPAFSEWELPKLQHFGYFLRGFMPLRMISPLLMGMGVHLKSLELPTLGKNELVTLPPPLLNSLPALETLILDIFKVVLPTSPPEPHPNLRILGWRLRLGSSLYDLRQLYQCRQYFTRQAFPSLEKVRIVHPRYFVDYSNNLTAALINYWHELVNDKEWVPIVDFDENPLDIPEEE